MAIIEISNYTGYDIRMTQGPSDNSNFVYVGSLTVSNK